MTVLEIGRLKVIYRAPDQVLGEMPGFYWGDLSTHAAGGPYLSVYECVRAYNEHEKQIRRQDMAVNTINGKPGELITIDFINKRRANV